MSAAFASGLPAEAAGICSASYFYFGIYIAFTARKDGRFRAMA
jgi:hypothetical protein